MALLRSHPESDSGKRHCSSALMSGMAIIALPLFLFYMEIALHLILFGGCGPKFVLYSFLFSVPVGLLCLLLCSFAGRKMSNALLITIPALFTLYFEVQLVYCKYFKDFFYWNLLRIAGAALTDFGKEVAGTIVSNAIYILLLLIPVLLFAVFGRRMEKHIPRTRKSRIISGVTAIFLFFTGIMIMNADDSQLGDRYYYHEGFVMSEGISRFGVLTALRLDTRYTLFGRHDGRGKDLPPETRPDWKDIFETDKPQESEETAPPETQQPKETLPEKETEAFPETAPEETQPSVTETPETEPPLPPVDTSPNVMNIDFKALIDGTWSDSMKAAHRFFSEREPTNKNEYTGMFAGKNLIFITAEAWSNAAISEKLTPTLWKMKNEGFRFENYFCSVWGGSTATGEYANITGNFYRQPGCLWISRNKLNKFTLGNVLGKQGYSCYAFHNHDYDYYYRDRSHPSYGYEWRAIGNWEKSSLFTDVWPRSDRELAENTLSYIPTDGTPFHFYYMTVSGHGCQTFFGNHQAANHREEVMSAGLNYQYEDSYGYLASQIELELMVKTLYDDLEKKGLLENTVFVIAPDHYPYKITDKSEEVNMAILAELYGLPAENIYTNYELYRAPLIIWSPTMKNPVTVKKVCSAPDILPTMLNLFGAEYDSRLIMGRDILSDCEGFVILNMSNSGSVAANDNWLTDYGFYNSASGTFTPFPGITVKEEQLPAYVSYYNGLLQTLFRFSYYVLENDYYRVVFPNG